MARSTIDLLNPMNNPLVHNPDAIGSAKLTKSDKAIQKALKKASIEGIPFVGKQSFTAAEEETGVEVKEQVCDVVTLQKTLEDGNLDGGDEASLKERNNSDNDDDASLKTGLPHLTRKVLDESDNKIRLESNADSKSGTYFTETLRGTERIQSVMPESDKLKEMGPSTIGLTERFSDSYSCVLADGSIVKRFSSIALHS